MTLFHRMQGVVVFTHFEVLSALPALTISENVGVLLSSSNNQWFFNGDLIAGTSNQQYEPQTAGNYTFAVVNENGCVSLSDDYYFTNIWCKEV